MDKFPGTKLLVEDAGMAYRQVNAIWKDDSDPVHCPAYGAFAQCFEIMNTYLQLAGAARMKEGKYGLAVLEPFLRFISDDDDALLIRIQIHNRTSLFAGVKFPIGVQDNIF